MSDQIARPRPSPADFVTIGNGVCGFLALAVAGRLVFAPHGADSRFTHHTLVICLLLYGIGMTCDVLDGPVARRTGSSGLGPSLDVVCDAATFGFVPAVLLIAVTSGSGWHWTVVVAACIYAAATILRLARFAAMDESAGALARAGRDAPVRGAFNGMPSPVGGNCILALVVLAPPAGVCAIAAALVAALLVADFEYPNNSSWGGVFVGALLLASFAGIAGVISLDVPAVIALGGLVPTAALGVGRRLLSAA
ncbi:MAG: CDP-alcohol phosphatidyltransferase family protein [Solirubrobacteraceae bacterium]